MTSPPPELPSFQSFVESTNGSLRMKSLPERCTTCAINPHQYEIVNLRRHNGPLCDGDPHDGFFWSAKEDASVASPCDSSSCSCDDADTDVDDHAMSESGPDSPSAVSGTPTKSRRPSHALKNKKKRKMYLTEQQRYEIVCRVLSGGKQAHVARQYGVTRAAVSYLLKHHSEIMHRVLTMHADCCLQRAAATAAAMDTAA